MSHWTITETYSVERLHPSGALVVSAMARDFYGDYRVSMRYEGYTVEEATGLFLEAYGHLLAD